MIHIYCGDGKGKTTAACGLAVRAAGSGMNVLFTQFFKNGKSSEVSAISEISNIHTMYSERCFGRWKNLTDDSRKAAAEAYSQLLDNIICDAKKYDMIVLDEAISAYRYGVIDGLYNFLMLEGKQREIVLTGRDPALELVEIADYVTEMKKIKHPFDHGIKARRGIEY